MDRWKDNRLEEWIDGRIKGRKNGWVERYQEGRMDGWKDNRKEEWIGGRITGRKNGQMEG